LGSAGATGFVDITVPPVIRARLQSPFMHLLVIRHGPAEDREVFAKTGREDDLRPLTRAGRKEMGKAAKGLERVVDSIDVIASSPLTRAVETADCVAEVFEDAKRVVREELSPGAPARKLIKWLQSQPARATVAVVGHEPDLSRLISALLAGDPRPIVEMKKGAACLLALGSDAGTGRAVLCWLMTRSQLRQLA